MKGSSLEQRVAALEQEVADLKAAVANGGQVKGWRQWLGFIGDDEGMKEIFDTAMALREKDREKARRRQRAGRKAKS